MIIKKTELKDGMEVWYELLIFTKGRTLNTSPYSIIRPVKGRLEIANITSYGKEDEKLFRIRFDNDRRVININSRFYGSCLEKSLFATEEDAKEAWNMYLQTEIERRKELLKANIEQLEKYYKY